MEKIDINKVERAMPNGVPAKIRGLDANGNGIVTHIGEIPIPKISTYLTEVGIGVSSGINKPCFIYIQNPANSYEISIASFINKIIYPIVDISEIDFSKENPSKQISLYVENGMIYTRLNNPVSPRSVLIWRISIVE